VPFKIFDKINDRVDNYRRQRQYNLFSEYQEAYARDLNIIESATTFRDPNSLYKYMHHYFHHYCPEKIQSHRSYFKIESRGFGEDAFHAMWYLLLRHFKPKKCLEIGVYRGQVISLLSMIAHVLEYECEVHGISPFTSLGDEVSNYMEEADYLQDVLEAYNHFNLPPPVLVQSLSNEALATEHISSHEWDLIYIDGGHDYETALGDYNICKNYLSINGLLVLDDASLGTDFVAPLFSFAGHPGPSKVARQNADKEMRSICAVGHNNIYQRI